MASSKYGTQMNVNNYTINNIKKAPDLPGVYVWYCSLCIGKADIKDSVGFIQLLESYISKYGPQQMTLNASLNFDLFWEGQIDHRTKDTTYSTITEDCFSKKSLELAANMLMKSQHLFFQPLYIGKAETSLKSRLNQHVSEFMRLRELLASSADVNYRGEDDFAQRAAAAGYNEDQLFVYTLDVGNDNNMSKEELGKSVRLVEMFLNRCATPLLGRR